MFYSTKVALTSYERSVCTQQIPWCVREGIVSNSSGHPRQSDEVHGNKNDKHSKSEADVGPVRYNEPPRLMGGQNVLIGVHTLYPLLAGNKVLITKSNIAEQIK